MTKNMNLARVLVSLVVLGLAALFGGCTSDKAGASSLAGTWRGTVVETETCTDSNGKLSGSGSGQGAFDFSLDASGHFTSFKLGDSWYATKSNLDGKLQVDGNNVTGGLKFDLTLADSDGTQKLKDNYSFLGTLESATLMRLQSSGTSVNLTTGERCAHSFNPAEFQKL